MSETKLGAILTVAESITIDGEPIAPGEHVVFNTTVYPGQTVVWEVPLVENAEGAPTVNMSYGFSFGGVAPDAFDCWSWTINGKPHDPRPENLLPIKGGEAHDIRIEIGLSRDIKVGTKISLTAAITKAGFVSN